MGSTREAKGLVHPMTSICEQIESIHGTKRSEVKSSSPGSEQHMFFAK